MIERLADMGRHCWEIAQYSKGECLEGVGILSSVRNNELRDKVPTIFKKIGCEVILRDIEECHCHKYEITG